MGTTKKHRKPRPADLQTARHRRAFPLQHVVLFLIRFYQLTLSPWLGGACRFTPSCSSYALEAVKRYGAGQGTWLALKRLARCHPFHRGAYFDPVPLSPLTRRDYPS